MLKSFKSFIENRTAGRNKTTANRSIGGLTMCKQCYTFRYKNSWHFERPELLTTESEATFPVKFTQCPACVEQENAFYETESNLVLGRG